MEWWINPSGRIKLWRLSRIGRYIDAKEREEIVHILNSFHIFRDFGYINPNPRYKQGAELFGSILLNFSHCCASMYLLYCACQKICSDKKMEVFRIDFVADYDEFFECFFSGIQLHSRWRSSMILCPLLIEIYFITLRVFMTKYFRESSDSILKNIKDQYLFYCNWYKSIFLILKHDWFFNAYILKEKAIILMNTDNLQGDATAIHIRSGEQANIIIPPGCPHNQITIINH